MATVAGIDEAGFGPLLGPLVVSAVAFEVPEALLGADLWQALAPGIARTARKRHAGLAIGDSKKLYKGSAARASAARQPKTADGLEHLERGVLGMFSMIAQGTDSLRKLLGWACPGVLEALEAYPWYRGRDVALPAGVDAAGLRLRVREAGRAMQAAGVRLTAGRCEVLPVGQYNALVRSTDNKATTLLDQTCRLIDWLWRHAAAGGNLTVLVDRQGGRQHYLRVLQRTYPGASLKILDEQDQYSGYRLSVDGRALEVHFMVDGEDRHLPVALASMTSKYVRELFMRLENEYWAAHMPGLRPTAGYYSDGKRFLADIAEATTRLNTPMELLVRQR